MIGVTVETVLVVGHDDARLDLVEQRSESARRNVHVDVHERVGFAVLGPAHHARIVVAEVHHAREPGVSGGTLEFTRPRGGGRHTVVSLHRTGTTPLVEAEDAVGAGNEDDLVAERAVVRRDPCREQCFVIGVRVYADQGRSFLHC